MRANEYQTRAMSTRLPSCENATYMLFGLMAEVGEIADKIAKWRRKGVCRLDMIISSLNGRISGRYDFNPAKPLVRIPALLECIGIEDCKIDGIIELNLID